MLSLVKDWERIVSSFIIFLRLVRINVEVLHQRNAGHFMTDAPISFPYKL